MGDFMLPALMWGARLVLPFLGRGAVTTAATGATAGAITSGAAVGAAATAAPVAGAWGAGATVAGAATAAPVVAAATGSGFVPGVLSALFLNARGGVSVVKTLGMGAGAVAGVDALDGENDTAANLLKDGISGGVGLVAKTGGAVVEGGADAFTDIMDKTVVPAAKENGLYAVVPAIAALKLLGGGGFLDAAKVIGVLTAIIKIAENYGFKLPGVDLPGLSGQFNRAAVDITNDEWTRNLPRSAIEAKPEALAAPSM